MKIDEIRTQINEINSAKMFCISNGFMEPLQGNSWFQTAARTIADKSFIAGKVEANTELIGQSMKSRQDAYDAAVKNPKAWYVLDKKGEQVHIGDKVFDGNDVWVVEGLCQDGYFDNIGCMWPSSKCEKVIPDTREKIKEELVITFTDCVTGEIGDEKNLDDMAERFISRIEALEKQ